MLVLAKSTKPRPAIHGPATRHLQLYISWYNTAHSRVHFLLAHLENLKARYPMSSLLRTNRPRATLAISIGLLMLLSAAAPRVWAQFEVPPGTSATGVTLTESPATYTLDNGIVKAQIAKNSGDIVSLRFKGM